jgi:hypothetical protein
MSATPQRIAVKFPVSPDPKAPVDLEPFIGLYHRFIQQGRLEGLLLDVADYAHVPDGPGIVLIGHDVDYALDLQGGSAGLLTVRKRYADLSTADVLRDTLSRALGAVEAIEEDGSTGVSFSTASVTVQCFDRLRTPNTDDGYEALRKAVEPVADVLYGACEIDRAHTDDARRPLALTLRSGDAADAATLIARLSG